VQQTSAQNTDRNPSVEISPGGRPRPFWRQSGGVHTKTGATTIERRLADTVAFGMFIANPDLPARIWTGAPLTFDQSTSNGGGRAIAHGRLPMPAKAFPRSFHEGRKKRGNLAWREITRWSESDLKSRRCADGANLDMVGVTGSIPVVPTILRSRSERRMPRRSPLAKAGWAARATAAQTTFSIRGKSNCAA